MPREIKLVYSKDYALNIGNHVFPTSKYNLIKERLLESVFSDRIEFILPRPAPDEDVLLVHERSYLDKLNNGKLSREEILRLELPFSKKLIESALISCGGTIKASEIAFAGRLGIHIGGGFHHAFPDHGEGFCVLNDIAVAVRYVVRKSLARRALIVDCDLHHGNGTAAIFAGDASVFTFSIHQENNYPFLKPKSSLDIGLRDRACDKEYLSALQENVPKIMSDFKPEFLMYVAGADPYKDDQIGGLALTKEGLKKRDEFIYNQAIHYGIPIAVVLAGGYAFREEDTVDIHYNTIAAGLDLFYPRKQSTNHSLALNLNRVNGSGLRSGSGRLRGSAGAEPRNKRGRGCKPAGLHGTSMRS